MIIGLTGKNASGKGEVANYLKTKGFIYYSLSDVIREEATKRNLEHSRDNLINLGNELRENFGANYLAEQINDKIKQQLKSYRSKAKEIPKEFLGTENLRFSRASGELKNRQFLSNDKNLNFVVDSIRSPFEAKELMKNKGFVLVGIDAPIELRFKRLLERNRLGDARTLEEFKGQEQRENLKNDTNQQLDATFAMAKEVILNNGTLEDLHLRIEDMLNHLQRKQKRTIQRK